MKKFLMTTGILIAAGVAAHAGGLADAVVEADTMVPPAANDSVMDDSSDGSLPGWVLPVALVAVLIGVAAASGGDDDDGDGGTMS